MHIVPWVALCEVIAPHYPKAGNGRPPIGLERMLRIHFIQHWFNLADLAVRRPSTTAPACAASLASIWAMSRCPTPPRCSSSADCSMTTSWARPCLPRWAKNCRREASRSTPAPSWTPPSSARPARPRTHDKARDPEMHQTRKGQQWYFGMKLHIGVDSQTG
jgi:IS5 family transposase